MSFGFSDAGETFWYSGTATGNLWYIELTAAYDFTGKTYADAVRKTEIDNPSGMFWLSDDMNEVATFTGTTNFVSSLGDPYWEETTQYGGATNISGFSSGNITENGFLFGNLNSSGTGSGKIIINFIGGGSIDVGQVYRDGTSSSNNPSNSFCVPVNAGDYWELSGTYASTSVFFRPIN